jgi:hypothetical protein
VKRTRVQNRAESLHCADVSNQGDLFQEWRAADRAAHLAEQAVVKAALQSIDDAGPAPSRDEQEEAHRLRSTANDLFRLAMDEMAARVRAIKVAGRR